MQLVVLVLMALIQNYRDFTDVITYKYSTVCVCVCDTTLEPVNQL